MKILFTLIVILANFSIPKNWIEKRNEKWEMIDHQDAWIGNLKISSIRKGSVLNFSIKRQEIWTIVNKMLEIEQIFSTQVLFIKGFGTNWAFLIDL